ncbi:MAG TPA: hypothetical protein VF575_01425 [Candidatus Saccharimonadales bacterium]|jgi:hypothetical protein
MNKKKLLLIVAAFSIVIIGLGFAAHNQQAGTSRDTSGTTTADAYVGLTEKEAVARAEKDNVTYRIVRRDSESFTSTMDYSADRMNFEIDDGRITKAFAG